MRLRLLQVVAVVVFVALAGPAWAFTSVEGTVIGDQGFYWNAPGQVWIFPHALGDIDNRAAFQWNAGGAVTLASPFVNQLPVQNEPGAGFVLELADQLNVGLWISSFDPNYGAFVANGIAATGWDTFVGPIGGDPAGAPPGNGQDLFAVDPYDPTVTTGRKVDAFASYWLADAGIEAGLHVFMGSDDHSLHPDESLGPIDIDENSDDNTPPAFGAETSDEVKKGVFELTDRGIDLGAGFTGIKGLRADGSLQLNSVGVTWKPNALKDYLDAGGFGIGINARAHYDLDDKLTVGGFVRYNRLGLSFKPKRQRDGGDLVPFFTDEDEDTATPDPAPAPPTGDPGDPANELAPVAGIKYEQNTSDMQVAGLLRYRPMPRVTLWAAAGWSRNTFTQRTSVGNDWLLEQSTRTNGLPFLNLGFQGQVLDWLDVMLGAAKRSQGTTVALHTKDVRIPNNGEGQGGGAPANGEESNTNANRREITREVRNDTTRTQLMLGTRVHWGPLQLTGHLDPDVLLNGPFFLSGNNSGLWLWVSVAYDWDYDKDELSGNGLLDGKPSPHDAAPPAPKVPESTEG